MTADEIERRLDSLLKRRSEPLPAPSEGAWEALAASLGWSWPPAFRAFHAVVGRFRFQGELLLVEAADGSDTILEALRAEVSIGGWPDDLVPFQAVGNGDYFCLSMREGQGSGASYVFHEDRRVEQLHGSFAEWIRRLDEY